MNCIELIESINESLPSIDQIKKKLEASGNIYSDDYLANYRNERRLMANINSQQVSDELENLVYNTNVSLIGIGSMNFLPRLRNLGDDLWQFSSYNDYFLTCYSKANQAVFNAFMDENDYELICSSISEYFEFLNIVNMHYNNQVWGVDYQKESARIKINELLSNGFSEKWASEILTDWS